MNKKNKNKSSQMSRKQLENKKRKADILSIAENVFQETGFAAFKAETVAQKVHISVGTVYNSFASKEKLYAQVLEKIGNELVENIDLINKKYGPAKAIEKIIALRLSQHRRLGLFLTFFSGGYINRDDLSSSSIFDCPRDLYYKYLERISKIIERGICLGIFEPVNSHAAAIGFEGILNSFVSYWLDPNNPKQPEGSLNEIKKTVLELLRLHRQDTEPGNENDVRIPGREVFITKYDYLRLKELIEVAQMFDSGKYAESFDVLTKALTGSKIVNSEEVPSDVITMNSKLELVNQDTGETIISRLVFPSDLSADNAVSVLTPLGAMLLGQWKGSNIEFEQDGKAKRYIINDILYQPESAGDFHL
ncbi:MAG: TetR family transcriptional regulator [Victivallaceae bacterium]